MKQLRAAMQAKAAADDGTTSLSSDDSELSEDGSEECLGRGHEGERAPKRRRRRKDTETIRKLEQRERRMQLEVVNAQAEKDEAEEAKAKMLAEVVAPVRKVE